VKAATLPDDPHRLHYFHNLFLITLEHAHISVPLMLTLRIYRRWSVVWKHTLLNRCINCSFASNGQADIIWSVISSHCWHSLHLLCLWYFLCYYFTVNVCIQISCQLP
jgi:hypothetical protein